MNPSIQNRPLLKSVRRNLPRFIGAGLFVLSTLLFIATVTDRLTDGAVRKALVDDAVFSSSSSLISEKKLPIYCVKTDKKQIALTFDGAWGDGGYGTQKKKEGSFHSPSESNKTFSFLNILLPIHSVYSLIIDFFNILTNNFNQFCIKKCHK